MVGNDIVDLGDPEAQPGATHPRFDTRVFTADEQALIATSPARLRARWLLWAAKESAYKVLRKSDLRTEFVPKRLAVRFVGVDYSAGVVETDGRGIRFVATEDGDVIHAVAAANAEELRHAMWGVAPIGGADSSVATREFAIRALAPTLDVSVERLAIVTRQRVPQLYLDGLAVPGDLSLSHHGRYAAFAWQGGALRGVTP